MRKHQVSTLLVVGLTLVAAGTRAQTPSSDYGGQGAPGEPDRFGPAGIPPLSFLLGQASVQKELKLSPKMRQKLDQARAEALASLGPPSFPPPGLQAGQAAGPPAGAGLGPPGGIDASRLSETFRAEMRKRMQVVDKALVKLLSEVQAQRLKQIALQVAGVRAMNDEQTVQQLKLDSQQQAGIKPIQAETRQSILAIFERGQSAKKTRRQVDEVRRAALEKMLATLTSEQRLEWEKMTGEPFKGEIRFGPPAGGPPGGP